MYFYPYPCYNECKGMINVAKLLTNRDLAEYLQVSSMTLSRWRKEGLPFINIGTQIRFELEPVMKWLKENKGK